MFDVLRNGDDGDKMKKGKDGRPQESSSADSSKSVNYDLAKLDEVYVNYINTIKNLLEKIKKREPLKPYMSLLYEFLNDVFNRLVLDNSLLHTVYEETKEEYYLPYHIVNNTILTSFIGIKSGFNKSGLRELGLAAVLSDVGLDSMREVLAKPSGFNKAEYEFVKKHVSGSLDIVEEFGNVAETVKNAIKMHHERVDGSGYPAGLKLEEIPVYAKIIGLVDTYESLTHKRPYRDGSNAHKTIRLLLGSLKEGFDVESMKRLIDNMSIYPVGTIVTLDTMEIARVVDVKSGSPLRPIIMITHYSDGSPLAEPKILDLSVSLSPNIMDTP